MTCKWHWLMGYVTIYLTQACWDVPWLVGAMTWQRSWEHLASASIKTSLNRKCIFKGSIFHCYVSLPECTPLKINIEASQKLKITQLMKRKNIFKTSNFGLHVYSIIFQGEKKKHSPPPQKKTPKDPHVPFSPCAGLLPPWPDRPFVFMTHKTSMSLVCIGGTPGPLTVDFVKVFLYIGGPFIKMIRLLFLC